ncbi:hypothetical protein LI095_10800, partial [Veillonella atypica]|uniref:hypothetical protein n=1 Tax=Veillonella atypica TaxID=39777 RepID=UPI001D0608A2
YFYIFEKEIVLFGIAQIFHFPVSTINTGLTFLYADTLSAICNIPGNTIIEAEQHLNVFFATHSLHVHI